MARESWLANFRLEEGREAEKERSDAHGGELVFIVGGR